MARKEKSGNWFGRHKILRVILGLIIFSAIAGSSASGKKTGSTNTNGSSPSSKSASARQVTGTLTTIGAGTFTGGKDVPIGLYDVTAGGGQSGNFIVHGSDSYNEILGSTGVDKVRAKISADSQIQISSLSSVTFTPVTAAFVTSQTTINLYAGTFTVGEDIAAGDYTVSPGSGQSGNFIVHGRDSYNEILGGDTNYGGVPSLTVSLHEGSEITISSLSQVAFTPR